LNTKDSSLGEKKAMTSTVCQALFDIYRNPNSQPSPPQDGLTIYGDAGLLFQNCSTLPLVDVYNQY